MRNSAFGIGNLILVLAMLALTACGFHLRGLADLSFHTLYMQKSGAPVIAAELKRIFKANSIAVVNTPEEAEIQLELMSEKSEKRILSLSGGGRVREYELLFQVNFRTRESSNTPWSAVQTVDGRRDYSYDDTQLLAKEGEELRLYNDMRSDATREIMRRLSALKPSAKPSASR